MDQDWVRAQVPNPYFLKLNLLSIMHFVLSELFYSVFPDISLLYYLSGYKRPGSDKPGTNVSLLIKIRYIYIYTKNEKRFMFWFYENLAFIPFISVDSELL
jgi:hypothetical protein